MTRINFWRIIVMMVIIAVALDGMMGDREKKRKIKELFARKAEKIQRIGYRIVAVAFAIWTIWHLAMVYGMYKEPIRITQQSLRLIDSIPSYEDAEHLPLDMPFASQEALELVPLEPVSAMSLPMHFQNPTNEEDLWNASPWGLCLSFRVVTDKLPVY